MFQIEFYETEKGIQPAKEILLSLDTKMRAKMVNTISILQDNGYELREPYSKYLSEGIFELRARVGSDITRVLYFFYLNPAKNTPTSASGGMNSLQTASLSQNTKSEQI